MKNSNSAPWILGGIVILAALLRVLRLDFQPLWWDEGYSVFFATRDFGTLLARTAIDIHPPLYYALMQGWIFAFGKDAVALRLLSVAIGVAAIPLLYLVAKNLFDRRTTLFAAFLFAIAPLQIYYAQELRMYGLVTLLGLASVALQLKILNSEFEIQNSKLEIGSWRLEIGGWKLETLDLLYIFCATALLYTQYFAAFLILAQMLVVLFLHFRHFPDFLHSPHFPLSLRAWLIRWLIVGALYLPWVLFAGPKLYTYVTAKVGIEQYARLDPLTYLTQHLAAFSTGHVSEWTWLAWGAVVFVALALFGIVASRKSQVTKRDTRYAIRDSPSAISHLPSAIGYTLSAIYLFVPLALGFLVNLVYTFHPLRYERLLLFAAPFFLILVARGIVALFERQRVLGYAASALVVILCALSLYDFYTVERYPDEDYRPLIAEMEKTAAPNDLVYALYPWQIGYLETYYRGARLNIVEVDADTWIRNPEVLDRELREMREMNPRAWILAFQKQGRILEDRLTNEYINDYLVADQTFGNTRLLYFVQGNTTDFELAPIVFGSDLLLRVNYAAFDPPGNVPTLALARFGWNAANENYSYSLRVTDASGNKIAQQDAPIPDGATTLRRALALPKNLAPGEYTLRLVAYRRADGVPLTLPGGAPDVALAKFTIAP